MTDWSLDSKVINNEQLIIIAKMNARDLYSEIIKYICLRFK